MAENNISDLVKRYEHALESGKSIYFDADEFEELVEYFDSQNDVETAKEIVDAGLAIHPENNSLIYQKAKFIVYDGGYLEAIQLLNKFSGSYDFDLYLLKIDCLLHLNLYAEAYSLTKELLEKEEDESMDNVLAELGFLYVETDYFAESVLYFKESLKHNPENIDVLCDLAYAYEMLGDFDSAIDITNKILDIEPYTYEAWVNLGKLYSLKDEYEKAIDAFDFALTINDSDEGILKLKSHCLSLLGRIDEAIEILKGILDTGSKDSMTYFLLADCYQAAEMYKEALECLDKYQEAEGESVELISKKVQLFIQKEDFDAASVILDKSMLDYPESTDLMVLAGGIKFQQEQYDEAEDYYLKAYTTSTDNYHIIDRLSIINIRKGKYLQAANYTEKLLDFDFNDSAVKQRLASLYFELNDEEQFNRLLDIFTDKELQAFFELVYSLSFSESFEREILISYLNKARESRLLYKGIQY